MSKLVNFYGLLRTRPRQGQLPNDEQYEAVNVEFQHSGSSKRKGWKTFKQMVKVLDNLNTKYKKLGQVGVFTVRLPLKGGK